MAVVTASFAILEVVTLASLSFVVSTASLAMSVTAIVPSNIFNEFTLPVPMAVTPALSVVTSPLSVTSVAIFEAFPM